MVNKFVIYSKIIKIIKIKFKFLSYYSQIVIIFIYY